MSYSTTVCSPSGPCNWIRSAIRPCLRGLLVADQAGVLRLSHLIEPSSQDYRVMTGSDWMPCLVEAHRTGLYQRPIQHLGNWLSRSEHREASNFMSAAGSTGLTMW